MRIARIATWTFLAACLAFGVAAIIAPAHAANRKPLVIGSAGVQQQLQSADRTTDGTNPYVTSSGTRTANHCAQFAADTAAGTPVVTDSGAACGGGGGGGTRVFVGSYTVSGSTTSQVSSASLTGGVGIPSSGYTTLIIRIVGRSLNTADTNGNANLTLQLNGDSTTGNYTTTNYGIVHTSTTTPFSGSTNPNANGGFAGGLPNSTGGVAGFGVETITISLFNQSAIPSPVSSQFSFRSTGGDGGRFGSTMFNYIQSAKITSFQISCYNDAITTLNDFASGTLIEVYAEQ